MREKHQVHLASFCCFKTLKTWRKKVLRETLEMGWALSKHDADTYRFIILLEEFAGNILERMKLFVTILENVYNNSSSNLIIYWCKCVLILILTKAPSSFPGLSPEANMYVLPIVLIFSIPLNFGFKSNLSKSQMISFSSRRHSRPCLLTSVSS